MNTDLTWEQGEYSISTERSHLDVDVIHAFLQTAYWSPGVARTIVEKSLEHSLPFGVYHRGKQIGLARVISDYATFAYIADVFILEEYRGRGLSKWLIETILSHPELQGLRRWFLGTKDAHGLYRKFGFETPAEPGRYMVKQMATQSVQAAASEQ